MAQPPQKRLIEWLIGKLIPKSVINTLLRIKTIKYEVGDYSDDK